MKFTAKEGIAIAAVNIALARSGRGNFLMHGRTGGKTFSDAVKSEIILRGMSDTGCICEAGVSFEDGMGRVSVLLITKLPGDVGSSVTNSCVFNYSKEAGFSVKKKLGVPDSRGSHISNLGF